MFAGGVDFEISYDVKIPIATRNYVLCINVTIVEMLESNRTFIIRINKTALHPDIVLVEPYEATVTIMDDECKQYKNGTY